MGFRAGLIAVLLLGAAAGWAQMSDPAPFVAQSGKILLPLDLGGDRLFHFVYDTTATQGVIDRNLLPPYLTAQAIPVASARLAAYPLGSLLFHGVDLRAGPGVDGILPAAWVPYALTLNFSSSTYVLSPAAPASNTTDGYTIPLIAAEDGTVRVMASINGSEPFEAIVDTRLAAALVLPKSMAWNEGWLTPESPVLTVLPGGESPALGRTQARFDRLAVGRAALDRPICMVVDSDAVPRLGTGFLRRFRVCLDLPSRYLRLEPEGLGVPADGPVVGVGVTPARLDPEGYWLIHVAQASPADRAGLRPGDRLSAINRKPMKGASVDLVQSLLTVADGERVSIGVLRDGEVDHILMVARALL